MIVDEKKEKYQHTIEHDYANRSWLCGHVTCKYDDLVKAFGKPHDTYIDGKIDVEWSFKVSSKDEAIDGVNFTVYNWKNGDAYLEDGTPISSITEWNIGGTGYHAVMACLEVLIERGIEI